MRTEHSLRIGIIPFPDGSYIIEFSYWSPIEGGFFRLVSSRTIAPNSEALPKVIGTLLPYASFENKPEYGKALRTE
jgi:hypothetical protein